MSVLVSVRSRSILFFFLRVHSRFVTYDSGIGGVYLFTFRRGRWEINHEKSSTEKYEVLL